MVDSKPTLQERLRSKADLVDDGVKSFAQDLHREAEAEGDRVTAAVESFISLLSRGGKRHRGMLTMTGYELLGGSNPKVATSAAAAVEVFHAYLLVMDDVADASTLRRGGPTAHIALEQYFREQGASNDEAKLGIDVAQTTALLAQHRAQELFLNLPVTLEQKVKAMQILNGRLARTGMGQILDILSAGFEDIHTDEIIKIATYKTAYYTYLLPLQVGAALAGASQEDLDHFTDYSLNAGLAFQLQDDIIGIFSDEGVTGKSRKSDLVEGKKTLIMSLALERADSPKRHVLELALGDDPGLTDAHFERCLEIIQETGALEETTKLIDRYTDAALAALDLVPDSWPPDHVNFLRDIAKYGANRPV